VYRNNVMVSLIDALADTYPVLQALVGEAFFRAMARLFAQNHPPQTAVMAHYGHNFANFIDAFAPAASVPYLADIARLEMARVMAYHAADVAPLQTGLVHAALSQPKQLLTLRLVLHPSVAIIESDFAIFSIWAAHQSASHAPCADADHAQAVLVYRAGLEVQAQLLSVGIARFIKALLDLKPLPDCAHEASQDDPDFDLTSALSLLLRLQIITHLHTGDTP
jgi:hypothetical protein